MSLRPIQDVVIIRPDTPEEYHGLIIIPERYRTLLWAGKVVAVGPGRVNRKGKFIPTTVRPGQRVLIQTSQAVQVDHEEEEYMFTREDKILGIIRGESTLEPIGKQPLTRREWEELKKQQDRQAAGG